MLYNVICPRCGKLNRVYLGETDGRMECSQCKTDVYTPLLISADTLALHTTGLSNPTSR